MYTENALLFPRQAIASLRGLRGQKWEDLVLRVMSLPECHEESLAFMLMMVNLNGCADCETDSYRAMRGCGSCSIQTMRRYKGTDDDLLQLFDAALSEVRAFSNQRHALSYLVQPNVVLLEAL